MLGYDIMGLLADRQSTNAVWSKYLVKANTYHIQPRLLKGNLILAKGLYTVRVKEQRQLTRYLESPESLADAYKLFAIICTCFVVNSHYSDQNSISLDSS